MIPKRIFPLLLPCLFVSCWLWNIGIAGASDIRVALLIGNETGWRADPKLRYAVTGDLLPLARKLRTLGFECKVLANPNATQVRQGIQWVKQRLSRAPKVDTFLFYYSGHADQTHFHFGSKGVHPFSYKDFSRFFSRIQAKRKIALLDSCYSGEVIRQFGSLTNYQRLLRSGGSKGVLRRRHKINLKKYLLPNQGKEQGVRIISSSLSLAWELKMYQASVFTFHILQGLRGHADSNRDGKISWDELFDYASRKVNEDTNQKPQQFLLLTRQSPYALAPAYGSHLLIGKEVIGDIKVSVANFLWRKQKRRKHVIRLEVIPGKGRVFLHKNQRCYYQPIKLPKGRELRLSNQWSPLSCRKVARLQKGLIKLTPRVTLQTNKPKKKEHWTISLGGDALLSSTPSNQAAFGSTFTLRHTHIAMSVGVWGSTTEANGQPNDTVLYAIQIHGGWTWKLSRLRLFLGGFVGLTLAMDNIQNDFQTTPHIWGGASITASFALHPNWSVYLDARPGLALSTLLTESRAQFHIALSLGLQFHLI